MNVDLLRHQQRWKDGLQELRTGFATLEAQVLLTIRTTLCLCWWRTAHFYCELTNINDYKHKEKTG